MNDFINKKLIFAEFGVILEFEVQKGIFKRKERGQGQSRSFKKDFFY